MSADIVARMADIAEAGAGHRAAGRKVAGEEVARILAARHMVAEAAAAARRRPLVAVAAGSIGRVEVRRRRVEEGAGLHTAEEMAHRRAEEVVARSPEEAGEAAGSIGPEPEVEGRRTAAAEAVAGSTPLAVGEGADHKVGTQNKTSQANALYAT